MLHDLCAHRLARLLTTHACVFHRLAQFFHRLDAVLLGDLEHALIDFVLDLLRVFELLALLQKQLLVDKDGDQLELPPLDLGIRILIRHTALHRLLDALLHFPLQLREGDNAVVDLGNDLIDDDRLTFLSAHEGRRQKARANHKKRGNHC